MSGFVASLFVAAALITGAGVLVVKARNEARARVANQAAHVVALRTSQLSSELQLLIENVALYSHSSDGIIAFANTGPARLDLITYAASEALNQLQDDETPKAGQASILNGAGGNLLQSSPNVSLGIDDQYGALPTHLTGFQDPDSASSPSVVSSLGPTSAGGGMAPLNLFALIRTAVGRPKKWLLLTIPGNDLLGVYDERAHTQTLLGGGEPGQALSVSIRGGSAPPIAARSPLDKLVTRSDRQSGEVELDGHIWAYELLPATLGDSSYPWSFIASRT
jgi:hypothetical protein